ncbi:hypothetical protein EMIHUDRAFT_235010 [Emiliania huxleyi CCMP1516]|uniref:Serine aminopeptidase S33 domain-containing protein n=2 Tax=Emiliania huxleyi TaxID=2903 RepID=A0A0D3JXJ6_EMIH1|nr:hypothetical protein EMIHUDRAFT_235010 [Emiliania huxleyi CCMP1516]EOD28231.1 hypothetical protein EMIHUDRAFT_235010 [Emiliania huxleyi CCMP1516]|eukprot:XP_005780660.1 hypothetical protein EMIHUDRAFT_235010 [Emiliania huxleyi CCMP1516]
MLLLALSHALTIPTTLRAHRGNNRIERVRAYWRKDDASPLARRLDKIIAAAPALERPTYQPTPWARSAKANFVLATLRSRLAALRRNVEPPLTGRTTAVPSEPDLGVEWTKDEVGVTLPPEAPTTLLQSDLGWHLGRTFSAALRRQAPIVIFLHTITGTAAQTRWLMAGGVARGRTAGHVHDASRNTVPQRRDVSDVQLQLEAVRRAHPRASFLGMVGVSAGSGLLISYLGAAGSATPVGAACAICPAWDVGSAFGAMSEALPAAERGVRPRAASLHAPGRGQAQPAAERAMLAQIRSRFVRRNERLLRAYDSAAVDACLAAQSLSDLLAAHAPFAMRRRGATGDEYFAAHDPMAVRRNVSVPVLVLNAEDDFVCPASLARPDARGREWPVGPCDVRDASTTQPVGALLLITKSGSHVAFNEGPLGRKSFHTRVSLDFLDAARELAAAEAANSEAGTAELRGVVGEPGREARPPSIRKVGVV